VRAIFRQETEASHCAGAVRADATEFDWQTAAQESVMKKIPFPVFSIVLVTLAVLGGMAIAAQDRYTVKVPDGLAFSEFKGYETWQDVAVSQTETSLKVIAANTPMITAYRQGVPGNHKLFPEGSKIVKIEWSTKKNTVSPYFVMVPDTLKTVSFIEKNSKRFPDTHGWAYAQFAYDAASDTFKPSPLSSSGAECGYACHTTVAADDYIFTAYPKR
jgi:Cytochrome P460